MAERTPVDVRNLDRYGSAALPWERPRALLAAQTPHRDLAFFLTTAGPGGRPHTTGVGPLWIDGDMYFTSGPATRKARNLAANPVCTLACRLPGIDIVLEGEAARSVDGRMLEEAARRYSAGGWPAEVAGDSLTAPYSAPSAGPPPWHLYRLRFHTAVGVASVEPYGATRWTF